MSESLALMNERYSAFVDTLEAMEDVSGAEAIAEVRQMLDEIEEQMEDKLLNAARYRKHLQEQAKSVIGAEIKRLQDRKKAYENKADSIGKYLHWGLEQMPSNKVKNALGSLGLQDSPPSLAIVDPEAIPWEYWKRSGTVKSGEVVNLTGQTRIAAGDVISLFVVDKDAIMDLWKATGKQVAGCEITQGKHVRFR